MANINTGGFGWTDDGARQRFDSTIVDDAFLIPFVAMMQRTMRLVGVIPTFENFAQTEHGYDIKKDVDPTGWRKLRAWWDLILAIQRTPEDKNSVVLACCYIGQKQAMIGYQKFKPIDPARLRIDPGHAAKVREEVDRRFKDLILGVSGPKGDLGKIIRPRLVAIPGAKEAFIRKKNGRR